MTPKPTLRERLVTFFEKASGYKPTCDSGEHKALQSEIDTFRAVRHMLFGHGDDSGVHLQPSPDFFKKAPKH